MNFFRSKSYKGKVNKKLKPLRSNAKQTVALPDGGDSEDKDENETQEDLDEQQDQETVTWDAEQTVMKEVMKSKGFLTYCLNGLAGERTEEDASSIMYRIARILARSYYAKTGHALQAVDMFEWVETLITSEYSVMQETCVFFYKDDNREAATMVIYLTNFTFFLEWYTYMYCSREHKQVS